MKKVSLAGQVRGSWMVIVAVVVVAVAGFGIFRLHGVFGSSPGAPTADAGSADITSFNPKHLVLQVFGPPGTYDVTTTQPAIFANVVAQGDGDSLGCRITIDGAVKDERTVYTMSAYTYCLDKSG